LTGYVVGVFDNLQKIYYSVRSQRGVNYKFEKGGTIMSRGDACMSEIVSILGLATILLQKYLELQLLYSPFRSTSSLVVTQLKKFDDLIRSFCKKHQLLGVR